jgi:hypothetical protein
MIQFNSSDDDDVLRWTESQVESVICRRYQRQSSRKGTSVEERKLQEKQEGTTPATRKQATKQREE